nr:hypothetical protein [Desulfovibrio sp. DV]
MQQKYLPLVTRLGIIYAVLAVAFVAQAALSYSNGQRLKAVYQSQIQAARGLSDLAQDLYALRLKVFQYLGTSKPTEMDAIKTEVAALSSAIAKRLQSDTLGELSPLFATARAQYDSILKAHRDFKTKQAYQTIYGDSQAAFEESKTRITELSSRARAQAEAAEKTAFNTIIGVTIGAAVLVAAAPRLSGLLFQAGHRLAPESADGLCRESLPGRDGGAHRRRLPGRTAHSQRVPVPDGGQPAGSDQPGRRE